MERLGELNPYVSVECTDEDVVNHHQLLTKYQVCGVTIFSGVEDPFSDSFSHGC